MTDRVKLLTRNLDISFEVVIAALLNTGYEVNEPILLSRRLAEYIGLSFRPLRARGEIYETPLGLYYLVFIPKTVSIHIIDMCERVDSVNVAVSEDERKVLGSLEA